MEIIILLTLFLSSLLLGGSNRREGKISIFQPKQIVIPTIILNSRAVKLAIKAPHLLNTVATHDSPKGAHTTFIYTDIQIFQD